MSDARTAFDQWASAAISAELPEELNAAAIEAEISLWRYIGEVLEVHAAQRRLPKVQPGHIGAQLQVESRHERSDEESFPHPAATYRVSGLPKFPV